MNSLVSVVVPIYNAEKDLIRGVGCLQKQTYDRIEIILVDDCSTDNSLVLCKELQRSDQRIRVIEQEYNKGAGAARNAGLAVISGEFVTFFDVDDICESTMIEDAVTAMEKDHADLVLWGIKRAVSDGESYKVIKQSKLERERIESIELCREKWKQLRLSDSDAHLGSPCNKLYKKSIIDEFNLEFPDTRRMQDTLFNYDYFDHVANLSILSTAPYTYFFNNTQKKFFSKLKPDFFDNVVTHSRRFYDYMEKWKLIDDRMAIFLDNDMFGNLWYAIQACRNPTWTLNIGGKYDYIKKCMLDEYVQRRAIKAQVSIMEYQIPTKLIREKKAFSLFVYVYYTSIIDFLKERKKELFK